MYEHIATPHYPQVVLAFTYHGVKVEITTDLYHDKQIYSAWVIYTTGSAVAVPMAPTREIAINRTKKWIHTHFT